jgi:hypothetical protein
LFWERGGEKSEPTKIPPGPGIGFDNRTFIPQEFVVFIDGVEFATDLPDSILGWFDGKMLDYVDGQFLFLNAA